MASNDQGSLLLRKQLMGSYMNFFVKLFSCFVPVCVWEISALTLPIRIYLSATLNVTGVNRSSLLECVLWYSIWCPPGLALAVMCRLGMHMQQLWGKTFSVVETEVMWPLVVGSVYPCVCVYVFLHRASKEAS